MRVSEQKKAADFSAWFTKAEAAQIIGCSTKTIESFAQSGKLQQASRRRQETGALIAVYHPDDVERIRQERNPAAVTPFVVTSQNHSEPPYGGTVAPRQPQQGEILQALMASISANSQRVPEPSVRIAEKLFLSLDESAAFSGLPRRYLYERVKSGELPAIKTGAGWRIKRTDLSAL